MSLRSVSHPSDVSFEDNYIVRWTGKEKRFARDSAPLSLKFASDPRIVWRVRGRDFRLNPTTLMIVDHDEPYEVRVDLGNEVSAAGIFFGDELASRLERFRPILPRIIPSRETNSEFVYSVLSDESSPNQDDFLLAEAVELIRSCYLTFEVHKELLELKREITSKEVLASLYRARDLILSEPDSALNLERLAREAMVSKYHFHRLFRVAFGESCFHFLERTRLERARHLLCASQDSIDKIASHCGYPSGRALRLKFVRRFGVPPSEARAK